MGRFNPAIKARGDRAERLRRKAQRRAAKALAKGRSTDPDASGGSIAQQDSGGTA